MIDSADRPRPLPGHRIDAMDDLRALSRPGPGGWTCGRERAVWPTIAVPGMCPPRVHRDAPPLGRNKHHGRRRITGGRAREFLHFSVSLSDDDDDASRG